MKFIIILFLISTSVFSKDLTDYITSIEASYSTDMIYGTNGVELKANYDYYESHRLSALFGISMMYYHYDIANQADSSVQTIDYQFSGTHINFHAGSNIYISDNFSFLADLYAGLYLLHIYGSYNNTTYSASYSEDSYKLFFDYGAKLGMAYDITDEWSVQFSIFKSMRNIGEQLSFLLWFIGSEDAPTRFNIGVRYHF